MKLSKLVLPLSFLGLAPHASATATENAAMDNPSHKIVASVDNDTLSNAYKDSIAILEFDEDIDAVEVRNDFIAAYNKNPNGFDASSIAKIFEITDNPLYFYEHMNLSVPHAEYMTRNASANLLQKLHVSNRLEILGRSISIYADEISPEHSLELVANGKILPFVMNVQPLMRKALDKILLNIKIVNQNKKYTDALENIMRYAIANQDDSNAVKLYLDVFVATADEIRGYEAQGDAARPVSNSIEWLSKNIEKYNREITPNSQLDTQLQIKSPHEFVLNQYSNISHRVNLAKIYNAAYYDFIISNGNPQLLKPKYMDKRVQNLYTEYFMSMYFGRMADAGKMSPDDKKHYDKLLSAHPEIKLFAPYFSGVYVDVAGRDKFLDFLVILSTSAKQGRINIPRPVSTLFASCEKQVRESQPQIEQYNISLPVFNVSDVKRLSWYDYMQSPWNPNVVHNNIDSYLDSQLQSLMFQRETLQRLMQNNRPREISGIISTNVDER